MSIEYHDMVMLGISVYTAKLKCELSYFTTILARRGLKLVYLEICF